MRPLSVVIARRLTAMLGLAALLPSTAFAAGYDTPILYSARHMGMGGVAIGAVDDPSAIYHNPAGIAAQEAGALHLDFSPIMGKIKGTPSKTSGNIETNFSMSPAFLGAFAWRVHKYLSAGIAVYPAASSGGGYSYTTKDSKGTVTSTEDSAKLVFLEAAPTLAAELLPGLRLGVAGRFAQVSFQRTSIDTTGAESFPLHKLDMKGYAFNGIRVGLQYTTGDFDIGAVYRTGSTAIVESDTATLSGMPAVDASFSFILPSKAGIGVQFRGIKNLRLGADFEYIFNSENDKTEVKGRPCKDGIICKDLGDEIPVPNVANWQDSMTVRVGGAYKIGAFEPRVGYLLDTQAANKSYPSAFGSPPAPTHSVTAGLGYDFSRKIDISIAGAYRTGGTTVTAADIAAGKETCSFCGQPGEYALSLFGAYIDVRWRFGGASAKAADAAPVAPAPVAPVPAPAAPEALPVAPAPEPAAPEAAPEAPKR